MTGNSYARSVEVTNIDSTLQQYYVANIGEYNEEIGLLDDNTGTPTTFEQAFIIYNGEKIDITDRISTSGDNSYNYLEGWDIHNFARESGQYNHTFVIIKDEISYIGNAEIMWEE